MGNSGSIPNLIGVEKRVGDRVASPPTLDALNIEDITERKQAQVEREIFTRELFQLNQSFSQFVPRQFLQLLNKKSICDVKLGDQSQQNMSVLFADIRK